MKTKNLLILAIVICLTPVFSRAQVNSGSNGSDGAFNPTTNTVVNMADHPSGIYHYSSVNIPSGLIVSFIPNASNTPVVWLVQSNLVINGTVDVSAPLRQTWNQDQPTVQESGPGGFRGGNGGITGNGLGPGGGNVGPGPGLSTGNLGGNGSYATVGQRATIHGTNLQGTAGVVYGNNFLIPLLGGSGGAGGGASPGGGGGGAILIATSGTLTLNGSIFADGAGSRKMANCTPGPFSDPGGAGSGGSVRLVASQIIGTGVVNAIGGWTYEYCSSAIQLSQAGSGRIRVDAINDNFSGSVYGIFSRGYQPIIIPTAGQGVQLTVVSVAGVPVSATPTGGISTPDAVIAAQQSNPIPIVVHCSNIPLNTQITVEVKPVNGATISATGLNSVGTLSSSTATVSISMPRGGGLIYATASTSN